MNDGFTALISVLLVSAGMIAFLLCVVDSAYEYSDAVEKKESRIQASLNAGSCIDAAELMFARDYFISGLIKVAEFGCELHIANDQSGRITAYASSTFASVSVESYAKFEISNGAVDQIEPSSL